MLLKFDQIQDTDKSEQIQSLNVNGMFDSDFKSLLFPFRLTKLYDVRMDYRMYKFCEILWLTILVYSCK